MIQLISKNGKNSIELISAMFIKSSDILMISDDTRALHEMLETEGISISWGETMENLVETTGHYIESSTANGGTSDALFDGQIIVYFELS